MDAVELVALTNEATFEGVQSFDRSSSQSNQTCAGRLMHLLLRAVVALSVAATACQSRVEDAKPDTASAQQTVDSPAAPSRGHVSGPADSPRSKSASKSLAQPGASESASPRAIERTARDRPAIRRGT